MQKNITKLWGSAFTKAPKEQAVLFAAGRDVVGLPPADAVLIPYEIEASLAYTKALFDVGLIDEETKIALVGGLGQLQQEFDAGHFVLDPLQEDVQTNVECWLVEKLGSKIAGKIHTGRSRSEQCIVDTILYLKATNGMYIAEITKLVAVLYKSAKKYADVVMPAYTHHQHATVTTFGNMLHAYATEFTKDIARFQSWHALEEISPLGAAAAYGSTLPVSKDKINAYLKLNHVFENEIAALTFRGDAEMMFVFNVAVFLNHISSLAQTLILFSTKEFSFITVSDEYSTGSSIMPQKKNPDPLEVMKAKASICHGSLMSLLSLTKAPFVGYNRDLQWIKYIANDVISETMLVPAIMAGVIDTLAVKKQTMAGWTTHGHITAQAVMEGLILAYNIPMRQAKGVVELAIKHIGPEGNLTRKVVNGVLVAQGYPHKVTPDQWKTWTDPLTVAKKQMKKELV